MRQWIQIGLVLGTALIGCGALTGCAAPPPATRPIQLQTGGAVIDTGRPAPAPSSSPRPSSPRSSGPRSSASVGPFVSATRATSAPAVPPVAAVALPVAAPVTASVYFGQLSAVYGRLHTTITFNVPAATLTALAHTCVETVVFAHASGTTGAVYAVGIGSGWSAPEAAPLQTPQGTDRQYHQQLVTPPANAGAGTSFTLAGRIVTDAVDVTSGTAALRLLSRSGPAEVWRLGSSARVACGA